MFSTSKHGSVIRPKSIPRMSWLQIYRADNNNNNLFARLHAMIGKASQPNYMLCMLGAFMTLALLRDSGCRKSPECSSRVLLYTETYEELVEKFGTDDCKNGHISYYKDEWVAASWDSSDRQQKRVPLLGEGQYGKTYDLEDGALKHIPLTRINSEDNHVVRTMREMIFSSKIQNKYILTQEVLVPETPAKMENGCFLISQKAEGNLENRMKSQDLTESPETIKKWIFEIISGIRYLHSAGLMHRDIKTENILLFEDGLKICDMGILKYLDHDADTSHLPEGYKERQHSIVGDLTYVAPEVLDGRDYNQDADMWSVGIIYARLIACTIYKQFNKGKPEVGANRRIFGPRESVQDRQSFKGVMKAFDNYNKISTPENEDHEAHKKVMIQHLKLKIRKASGLDKMMISVEQANEAIDTLVGKNGLDLLLQLLTYDPKERITAQDAIQHDFFEACTDDEESLGMDDEVKNQLQRVERDIAARYQELGVVEGVATDDQKSQLLYWAANYWNTRDLDDDTRRRLLRAEQSFRD